MTRAGLEPATLALKVLGGASTCIHALRFPQHLSRLVSARVQRCRRNPTARVSLRVSTACRDLQRAADLLTRSADALALTHPVGADASRDTGRRAAPPILPGARSPKGRRSRVEIASVRLLDGPSG